MVRRVRFVASGQWHESEPEARGKECARGPAARLRRFFTEGFFSLRRRPQRR